jgi:hypothetical protein
LHVVAVAQDGMSVELTGGCLCGAVRYAVAPGLRMKPYACHCTDCQRRAGSSFAIQLGVMTADLKVEGELIEGEHIQPSGARAGIFACAKCLTRIYTTNDQRPGIANLRAGTLDSSPGLVPAAHLWVKSKQPWIVLPEDIPTLDEQPRTIEEWRVLLF